MSFALFALRTSLNAQAVFAPKSAGRRAATIFFTPLGGRLKAPHRAFLETADNTVTLSLHADKLHIRQPITPNPLSVKAYEWLPIATNNTANTPPKRILLLHGWQSNAARWKPLHDLLRSEGHHLFALDAPAHGASDGVMLNAVLYADALNAAYERFRPNVIIGHSFGGFAAAYFAAIFPRPDDLLEGVVLMGVPSDVTDIVKDFTDKLRLSNRVRKAVMNYFTERFGLPVEYFSVSAFVRRLEESQLEGLIIHDRHDQTAPFTDGEAIAKNWKRATFLATDGIGHSLQHPSIYAAISGFVKGLKSTAIK